MDLFDLVKEERHAPLAERMRPKTFADFVGQSHILAEGSLLRRAIRTDSLGSCIFYGPPGTGKTTLANIIAQNTKCAFVKLNAVSSGVADAKKVIEDAKERLKMYNRRTYLLLDECHRWSKAQSDCVLGAIEDGSIIFIGSTTENPFVSMTRAIVSRCRIFEFKKLEPSDIEKALKKAVNDEKNGLAMMNVAIEEAAIKHLLWAAAGDLRTALNALELAALTTQPDNSGNVNITLNDAQNSIQKKALSLDDNLYYDMISAFCKSLRGSDADAALYWSMRLLEGGCDPMLIARRLVVHSSEDVGMADSNALTVATNAMYALERIGYPEARIPLSHAIIYVCCAPKSNSVVNAMGAALGDVATADDKVPFHLRDKSYPIIADSGDAYLYPHDYGGYVKQQYLPDSIKDKRYYFPSGNGAEKDIKIKKSEE